MTTVAFPRKRVLSRAPRNPRSINPRSEFSRGLVYAFPLVGDSWPINLVTGTEATITNVNTFEKVAGALQVQARDNGYNGSTWGYIDAVNEDDFTTDISLSCWIRLENDPPTGHGDQNTGIWNWRGASSSRTHFPYTDSNIYASLGNDTRATFGNPSTDLTQWTHVVLTRTDTATGLKLYLNASQFGGDKDGNNGVSVAFASRNIFQDDPSFCQEGQLAFFSIWNRVLSAQEIERLYAPRERWALWADDVERTYFLPVAAAGGAEPVFMYHHRHHNRAA